MLCETVFRGKAGWAARRGGWKGLGGPGPPRDPADPPERSGKVAQERVPGLRAQQEPAAGATDAGGDGDEAEAQALGVARPLARREREQLQPGEQVVGEQRQQEVGRVGVEAAAGKVVCAEPELRLLDPVLDVGLGPVPGLELVRRALEVVGDEHPVVPLSVLERQLLALSERIAADDEAPLTLPRLRPPTDTRHLAFFPVAGGLPLPLGDLGDPLPDRGDQGRPDGVGDPLALELGEESLAEEALVGAQEEASRRWQPAQALAEEAPGAGRRGGMAVAQLRVQPLARFRDEADERVPGHLAGIGAACPLPRARGAVVLDEGRVEVERHLLALEQRADAGEEPVEGAVELADVAEVEARQKAPERRRVGDRVAAQLLLGCVGAQERRVLEALAARDQRLAERERLLRRGVTPLALLDRNRVEQLWELEALGEFAHQHEPGVRGDLLAGGSDLDQRRPPRYFHLQECLPVARRDVIATPMVSGREDVSWGVTCPLSQDPGS